jgi:hypothetical protein
LGQAQQCGGVKPVIGIPTLSHLDNWIFIRNTDIKTNNKKPTIPKMNDNINMDSTVAVSECS